MTAIFVRHRHKIGRYTLFDGATRHGAVRYFINFTTRRTPGISSNEYSLDSLGILRKVQGVGSYIAIGSVVRLFLIC